MQFVKEHGNAAVPDHLRNAPTTFMKELGYGKEYRYDHDEAEAHAGGQRFFPDDIADQQFYKPVERGLEIQIAEKLARIRASQ